MANNKKRSALGFLMEEDPNASQADRAVLGQQNAQNLLAMTQMGRTNIDNALQGTYGAEDNAPVDFDTGLDAGTRAKLSFRRTVEDKEAYLNELFPGQVRNVKGRLFVRKGGKDIAIDERGMTLGDLADLAGDSPQMVAALATALGTGGLGMGFLAQTLITGAVSMASGVAQDQIVRGMDDRPANIGESVVSRGVEAGLDMAIPAVGKGMMSAARKAIGPFARSTGDLERQAVKALYNIKGRTGIEIPLSAGQKTGNATLLGAESFAEGIAGGGKLSVLSAAQDAKVREVQRAILGGNHINELPSEKEIGQAAADLLGGKSRMLTHASGQMKKNVMESASDEIDRTISSITTGTPNQFSKSEVGSNIRKRVVGMREEFRAANKANYEAVHAAIGGDKPFVPMDGVTKALNDIKASLPQGVKEIQTDQGVQKVTGVIEELVPVELRKFLNASGSIPPKMTLKQAIQFRSFVNDLANEGSALPGIPDRYLKQLSHSITQAIDNGVSTAPNPDVGRLLAKANTYYKTNFPKFVQPGVSSILKETHLAGSVGDAAIVDRIKGSTDELFKFKRLLGENSPEYRQIRRVAIDDLIDQSKVDGLNRIGGKEFLAKIRGLDRETRAELFGGKIEDVIKDINLIRVADGSVDAATMNEILSGDPRQMSKRLQSAIRLEGARDRLYRNNLMKRIFSGDIESADIDASEFVSRFVDAASPDEIRKVMTQLGGNAGVDTKLVSDIRAKAIQQVLQRSQKVVRAEDIATRQIGNPEVLVDPAKLDRVIRDDGTKLVSLLGKDTFQFLEDILTVEAVRGKKESIGRHAGSLVQAGIRSKLLAGTDDSIIGGRLKVLPRLIQFRVMSRLLANDTFRSWAGRTTDISSMRKTRTAIIASAPVLRDVIEEFRDEPDKLEQIVHLLRLDAEEVGVTPRGSAADFLNATPQGQPPSQ